MLHIPLQSFDLLSRAGVENIHREGQKQRKLELQHPNDSINPQPVTESLTS